MTTQPVWHLDPTGMNDGDPYTRPLQIECTTDVSRMCFFILHSPLLSCRQSSWLAVPGSLQEIEPRH